MTLLVRVLLLFLLTILSLSLTAQVETKQILTYYKAFDSIGIRTPLKERYFVLKSDTSIKHGDYFFYNQQGDTLIYCQYQNNKLDGIYRQYYEHNLLKYRIRYQQGIKIDTGYYYNPSGKLQGYEVLKTLSVNKDTTIQQYTYYDAGQVRTHECQLKNDVMDGTYMAYYPNHQIKVIIHYRDGKKYGAFTAFYEDGKVMQKGFYRNDALDSIITSYHPNGQMKMEAHYSEGALNGTVRQYSKTGNLTMEAQYKNNTQNGLTKTYYPNGKIQTEENYQAGVLQGFFKTYYDNGQLESISQRMQGKRAGEFKQFSREGQLTLLANYANGEPDGENKAWYNSGAKKHELQFKSGRKIGINKYYFENGNLERLEDYNKDFTEVKIKRYYEDGALMEEGLYSIHPNETVEGSLWKKEGLWKGYYVNGKLQYSTPYENHKINGTSTTFHENGGTATIATYAFGIQIGPYQTFYPNGQVKETCTYKNNKKYGAYKHYHENGKISVTGHYVGDKKHGEFRYFDENGKLTKKEVYKNNFLITEK
jgi:antitoxin component YwqK of YwqJK toxin-antitoxin module